MPLGFKSGPPRSSRSVAGVGGASACWLVVPQSDHKWQMTHIIVILCNYYTLQSDWPYWPLELAGFPLRGKTKHLEPMQLRGIQSKTQQLRRKTIWNQQPGWDAPRQKKLKQKHLHPAPICALHGRFPSQFLCSGCTGSNRNTNEDLSMTATSHSFVDLGAISISNWYKLFARSHVDANTDHIRFQTEIVWQKLYNLKLGLED